MLRDIAATVHPADRESRRCCLSDEETWKTVKTRHPECYEMETQWPDGRSTCSRYWRSVPSLTVHGCQFEARDQMNGASAYLDGSVVYGDTDDQLHRLRTYYDGQVETECYGAFCGPIESTRGLNTLRRVLLREHNRVAERLAATNVHWDDTKLFLEARRIVVAQLQHVTLNEYAPAVLGEGALDPELAPLANGFYQGYSSSNQAGTYDAVALTALHALAWTWGVGLENSTQIEDYVTTSADRVDLAAAPDAAARLIHMGRDHGVPGYVELLADCLGEGVKVGAFDGDGFTRDLAGNLHLATKISGDIFPTPRATVGNGNVVRLEVEFVIIGRPLGLLSREKIEMIIESRLHGYRNRGDFRR